MIINKDIIKDVRGIIINILDYKDNDVIVSFISKEYGFIQCVVRGAKKATNKNYYLIKLFNELDFDMMNYQKNELAIFKSGTIINSCDYTKLNYDNINMLMLISECLYKIRNTDVNLSFRFYEVIKLIINHLENSNNNWFFLNYFLLIILKVLGLELVLDKCIYCGSQTKIKAFSRYELGFVCNDCLNINDDELIYNKEYLEYLYNLNKHREIDITKNIEKQVFRMLSETLYDRSGILLNSASML
ncbi:MAG: DNA repair protein RecO [Bacilli bacterium]|jgi:DNA repair protein RecO|nr:DNA repair protein RecO [Bacilli bacterium]